MTCSGGDSARRGRPRRGARRRRCPRWRRRRSRGCESVLPGAATAATRSTTPRCCGTTRRRCGSSSSRSATTPAVGRVLVLYDDAAVDGRVLGGRARRGAAAAPSAVPVAVASTLPELAADGRGRRAAQRRCRAAAQRAAPGAPADPARIAGDAAQPRGAGVPARWLAEHEAKEAAARRGHRGRPAGRADDRRRRGRLARARRPGRGQAHRPTCATRASAGALALDLRDEAGIRAAQRARSAPARCWSSAWPRRASSCSWRRAATASCRCSSSASAASGPRRSTTSP